LGFDAVGAADVVEAVAEGGHQAGQGALAKRMGRGAAEEGGGGTRGGGCGRRAQVDLLSIEIE
jgi:hypothetical protein